MSDENVKSFEDWAKEMPPEKQWLAASARSAFRIPLGREMTREEFNGLIEKTGRVEMLPAPKPNTEA